MTNFPEDNGKAPSREAGDKKLIAYLRTFILPTLVLKSILLYFGLKYSQYPDEGYGWGLMAAIVLSLLNFGFFIWKNWNDEEESR